MSIIQIEEQVERKGTHILMALYGMSGSGKTLSGLLLARGLAGPKGKVCLLDTENGRGRMYAKQVPGGYAYAELTPPFTGARYIEAIKDIAKAGYDVLVIDSASHEWEGYGGVLEQADTATDQWGKPLQGLIKWAKPKMQHKQFMQALLQTHMHIVFCLRAKEKLVQVDIERNGKRYKEIVSEGFVPIQDKGFKFEMTAQLLMESRQTERGPMGGFYVSEKCPGDLLDAFPAKGQIGIQAGEAVRAWLDEEQPVDLAFEAAKKQARAAADLGTVNLELFWKDPINKPFQKRLLPEMPNLKSLAAEADRAAAEEQTINEDPFPGDSLMDETDPFGAVAEAAE